MRKGFRKGVCAGLALTMLAGLTACGSNDVVSGGDSAANAALAKEYVYSEQPLELPDMGDNINFRMMSQQNDKIFVAYDVHNWDEETGASNNLFKLLSMDKDGSNIQVNDVQLYMGGVKPEGSEEAGEASTDEDSEKNEAVGAIEPRTAEAATLEEDAEAETADEEENTGDEEAATADEPVDDMAMKESYTYEYTGIGQCAISSDNKMYGVKDYYKEDYSDSENPISISENYICSWDIDGTMLWESKLESLQTEDSWSYVQKIIPMADGGVGVLLGGDKVEMILVSADGTMGERKALPETAESLSWASDMFVKGDGVVSFIYWDQVDGSKVYMNTYDFTTNTLGGEPWQLPDSFYMSGYMGIADGGEIADLIYTTSLGVYSLKRGDTQPTQIMSFINSDLSTNSMNQVAVLDDTHLMGFYYDDTDGSTRGGIFTKVNPEDIEDKAVLVLATNYVPWDLKNRVVDFNKNNSKYRIVIKDYSTYNTMEDYMAGYTQLNNDILASGMPDILVADSNMPLDSYIAKGLLADVDKLIAEDAELSQREFMQNVFDAYRVDGKLYYVIPSFYARTLIGKTSIVGDRTSWTMKEMMELVSTLPEGSQVIGELTRDSFIYMMMQFCGSDFIDVSTGKCAFDTENFIAMLEFAKTLPQELSEDYYGEDFWMTYDSQYREDRTILMNCYVSEPRDMNRNINGYFGEEISYIGFPTDSGNGSVLAANSQYVLSAKSANLEGAWEFVRYYLTEEYQKEMSYELPVDKAIFMEKVNETMEDPYYVDEDGVKTEYEDMFYINEESIPLPNMSQEQVNEFVSFIEGINKPAYYNEDIQNIITEEAEAFFSGQKTAQDVAAIIQSRAQIFVNENR